MKNDKSPGSDGFTAECYNFVWKDICTWTQKNHGDQNHF